MDFPEIEFANCLENAQKAMAEIGLDALLLTTEADVRYFSGFRTLFWESPTRPWFLVVPRRGKPIAVIPEIGAALMRSTWLDDVRTWSSPAALDDGVSLLADALQPYAHVGLPMGRETSLRMPLADFQDLRERLRHHEIVDATALVRALRMVKSEREVATIREICAIASNAFAQASRLFQTGQPLSDAFRAFKIELLSRGAEDVPYLVGGARQGGYADVISPPSQTLLQAGDVLMLDTGATLRGYFCDFDRNFAFGHASSDVKSAHNILWRATEAGLATARPGATAAAVFHAMSAVIGQGCGDVGRYGHGLGMQLTEPPSLIGWDETVLQEGMVITLEPSMTLSQGRMLVHEEKIVIRDGAPELLSQRTPSELPVLIA